MSTTPTRLSTLYSVQELMEAVGEEVGEGHLFVFDLDETLVVCEEPAFQCANMFRFKALFRSMWSPLDDEQKYLCMNAIAQSYPSRLLEPCTPSFLADIAKGGAKAIALTASLGGEVYERERIAKLRSLGIDFAAAFPGKASFSLTSLPSFLGHPPLLPRGGHLCQWPGEL